MKVCCCGTSDVDSGAFPVQGSVYEGAGRKLRGTEAMRMRNAVGFCCHARRHTYACTQHMRCA